MQLFWLSKFSNKNSIGVKKFNFLNSITFIVGEAKKTNFKKQLSFLGIFFKYAKDTSFVVENGDRRGRLYEY